MMVGACKAALVRGSVEWGSDQIRNGREGGDMPFINSVGLTGGGGNSADGIS